MFIFGFFNLSNYNIQKNAKVLEEIWKAKEFCLPYKYTYTLLKKNNVYELTKDNIFPYNNYKGFILIGTNKDLKLDKKITENINLKNHNKYVNINNSKLYSIIYRKKIFLFSMQKLIKFDSDLILHLDEKEILNVR